MNPIAGALYRVITLLKWPVAIVALLFLPGLLYALFVVTRGVAEHPGNCVPFLIGAAAYVVFFIGFAGRRIGFWTVVEHEVTHALFAWLTFHRVVGFSAMRSGGHIRYVGRG